jgi:hypothetical protein
MRFELAAGLIAHGVLDFAPHGLVALGRGDEVVGVDETHDDVVELGSDG